MSAADDDWADYGLPNPETDADVRAFLTEVGRAVQDAAHSHGDLAAGIALISMGSQFASSAGLPADQCKLLIDKTYEFSTMFTAKGGEG